MKYWLLLAMLLAVDQFGPGYALRFAHTPITVSTEVLIVGSPAKLTCNYVKFRTESVREITWYAGYNGIKSRIFAYHPTTGTKEGSQYSFITVHEDSASETELTITLTEFRHPVMTLGCDVEVLRDSGYGKLKNAKKIEEVNVTVVNSKQHQLHLRPGLTTETDRMDYTVKPGESLTVVCTSVGADPSPNLTLTINKIQWEQNFSGRTSSEDEVSSATPFTANTEPKRRLIGQLAQVTEDLFTTSESGSKVMVVECLAHYNDFLFDKKEMALQRRDAVSANPYLRDRDNQPAPSHSVWSDRAEQYGHRHVTDQYVNERKGKVYSQDQINTRLMDIMDQPRFDRQTLHAGYVLMITDLLDSEDHGGYGASSTILLGQLPDHVVSSLQTNYGRYNQISNFKYRLKMEPIEILNLLGNNGFRVVESLVHGQKMVWTMEYQKPN